MAESAPDLTVFPPLEDSVFIVHLFGGLDTNGNTKNIYISYDETSTATGVWTEKNDVPKLPSGVSPHGCPMFHIVNMEYQYWKLRAKAFSKANSSS